MKDYTREITKAAQKKSVTLFIKRGRSGYSVTIRID
jgi:hypothetical protein